MSPYDAIPGALAILFVVIEIIRDVRNKPAEE